MALDSIKMLRVFKDLEEAGFDGYYGDIITDLHTANTIDDLKTAHPVSQALGAKYLSPDDPPKKSSDGAFQSRDIKTPIETNFPTLDIPYNSPKSLKMLENIYKKYPAFKNMGDVIIKEDKTFTTDKTGAGDIEFFDPNVLENNSVHYKMGEPDQYDVKNPNDRGFGIIYNPDTNDEQHVMLDMLHGMYKDEAYLKIREDFESATMRANKGEYERDWRREQTENPKNDGEKAFRKNWVDGQIRNLMFEGTDADFEKHNYWIDAKKEYLSDKDVNKTFTQLKNYLQTD